MLNIRAAYIGGDSDEDIRHGNIQAVFTSPELLLSDDAWREVLITPMYRAKVKLIVADEAHSIIHW